MIINYDYKNVVCLEKATQKKKAQLVRSNSETE